MTSEIRAGDERLGAVDYGDFRVNFSIDERLPLFPAVARRAREMSIR